MYEYFLSSEIELGTLINAIDTHEKILYMPVKQVIYVNIYIILFLHYDSIVNDHYMIPLHKISQILYNLRKMFSSMFLVALLAAELHLRTIPASS